MERLHATCLVRPDAIASGPVAQPAAERRRRRTGLRTLRVHDDGVRVQETRIAFRNDPQRKRWREPPVRMCRKRLRFCFRRVTDCHIRVKRQVSSLVRKVLAVQIMSNHLVPCDRWIDREWLEHLGMDDPRRNRKRSSHRSLV